MEPVKRMLPIFKNSWYSRKLPNIYKSSNGLLNTERKYSVQGNREVIVKEKIQLSKPSVTKWKRPPFVKDMFLGKFDVELLAFPEILNNEELGELESTVTTINDLYRNKVNSKEIDDSKKIPDEVLQDLKDLGLFGRIIPVKYGGLGMTYTACTRLNEVLGLDWSVCATLAAHEFFATQVLLVAGTEEQKNKYLPDLASGRHIAALCFSEIKSGCDFHSIETKADYNLDRSCFLLNGSKSWVTNAEFADYYIVFAKTFNHADNKENNISVFMVDRNSEGIIVEPREKIGLQGLRTGVVHFKDTAVPLQNLLGKIGAGIEIFFKALPSLRFVMNSFTFGALKALLDSFTEYIIHTERVEKSLGDEQLVRERLSNINTTIYAMESLCYFTAAILDSTENPDIALESAIVKVFNSNATLFCLRELMKVLGSSSLMKHQQIERFYRDAQALAMFEGSNDMARLYIGLTGCQYYGRKKSEEVMMLRNSQFFPKNTLKNYIKRTRMQLRRIQFDQDLAGHLHPSLVEPANTLEENLQRFDVAVETLLTTHGTKIVDTQLDPIKLADIAIDFYAVASVLSRSSRSYCIGLKNSDHEIKLAHSFCYNAERRIRHNLEHIFEGCTQNNDGNNLILGEQVIDCKGYFAEHPLKHNF